VNAVVDSSGWLEYFADGPNAHHFEKPILDVGRLLVPAVAVYEVYKRVALQRGEEVALEAVAMLRQGKVVPLDDVVAIEAARVSVAHNLPMADSIMLATAQLNDAILWTQDADFVDVPGVRYFSKTR
jgi:predicted nucleic acid-binding protein